MKRWLPFCLFLLLNIPAVAQLQLVLPAGHTDAVKQAAFIKAARIYRRANTPEGFAAGEAFGAIRVSSREDPDVAMLLAPYVKAGNSGLAIA